MVLNTCLGTENQRLLAVLSSSERTSSSDEEGERIILEGDLGRRTLLKVLLKGPLGGVGRGRDIHIECSK